MMLGFRAFAAILIGVVPAGCCLGAAWYTGTVDRVATDVLGEATIAEDLQLIGLIVAFALALGWAYLMLRETVISLAGGQSFFDVPAVVRPVLGAGYRLTDHLLVDSGLAAPKLAELVSDRDLISARVAQVSRRKPETVPSVDQPVTLDLTTAPAPTGEPALGIPPPPKPIPEFAPVTIDPSLRGVGRQLDDDEWLVGMADSWWSIAETVRGDGAVWRELRDANVGRKQPSGMPVDETTDHPEPGTILFASLDGSAS